MASHDRLEPDPAPDPNPHPPRRYALPAGAVDTHAHVIGHDWIATRSYTPHPAPPEAYLRMLDATGMAYGVLVQVSVHGTDNSLMLEAVRANRARLRGIAVVNHDVPASDLRAMKEAGVVGLRLNTTTGGGVGVARLAEYEAICREFGWHLQFLVEAAQIPELAPKVSRLRVPAVFDHMGYVHPGEENDAPARALVSLLRDGAWAKVSGGFRATRIGPPYMDTVPLARMMIEAAPDRCVWGSDWPHVTFRGKMPNTGDLLDLLADWAPDAQTRDRILTDNAHRLYGFLPPSNAAGG